jgi:hypothetical protein
LMTEGEAQEEGTQVGAAGASVVGNKTTAAAQAPLSAATEGLMPEGLMTESEGGKVRAADSCLSVQEGRRQRQRKERRN